MDEKKIVLIFFVIFKSFLIISSGSLDQEDSSYSFYNLSTTNWTTCEEFLENTTFDPQSVVDVDWKIFYFWHFSSDDNYLIRFSIPYPMLVDRFRTELHDLKPPVNWTNSALFMETSIDLSALFVKSEKPGRFRMIPHLAFQYDNLPMSEFGFKLVYPGYLGIMNCKYRFCYALAPIEKMPTEENVHQEAQRLGFRGDYNRSYLFEKTPDLPVLEETDEDKDDPEWLDDDEE